MPWFRWAAFNVSKEQIREGIHAYNRVSVKPNEQRTTIKKSNLYLEIYKFYFLHLYPLDDICVMRMLVWMLHTDLYHLDQEFVVGRYGQADLNHMNALWWLTVRPMRATRSLVIWIITGRQHGCAWTIDCIADEGRLAENRHPHYRSKFTRERRMLADYDSDEYAGWTLTQAKVKAQEARAAELPSAMAEHSRREVPDATSSEGGDDSHQDDDDDDDQPAPTRRRSEASGIQVEEPRGRASHRPADPRSRLQRNRLPRGESVVDNTRADAFGLGVFLERRGYAPDDSQRYTDQRARLQRVAERAEARRAREAEEARQAQLDAAFIDDADVSLDASSSDSEDSFAEVPNPGAHMPLRPRASQSGDQHTDGGAAADDEADDEAEEEV